MDTTASARVLLGNVNKEILNEITTNYVNFYQFLRKLRENEKWQECWAGAKGNVTRNFWFQTRSDETLADCWILWTVDVYDPEVSRQTYWSVSTDDSKIIRFNRTDSTLKWSFPSIFTLSVSIDIPFLVSSFVPLVTFCLLHDRMLYKTHLKRIKS